MHCSKRDSALQKQRTFFFRAATDLSCLNSFILKLLDEKGKIRHLHELLPSLPKVTSWTLRSEFALLDFSTLAQLDEQSWRSSGRVGRERAALP